jgi:hypothetical protein
VAIFLVTSPNALAAGNTATKGYSGVRGNVQNAVAATGAGTGSSNGGNLPFTGFDITLMIGGAILLVLVGAALRRFSGNHA